MSVEQSNERRASTITFNQDYSARVVWNRTKTEGNVELKSGQPLRVIGVYEPGRKAHFEIVERALELEPGDILLDVPFEVLRVTLPSIDNYDSP